MQETRPGDTRDTPKRRQQAARLLLLLCLAAPALSGCSTISYYSQAIRGHCQIQSRQRPIPALLADSKVPEDLKQRLRLVLDLRSFAENALGLKPNGHYLAYADLHRPFVVWDVYAAPEFSTEARTWWYPVVGSLEYRGFFSREKARAFAQHLAQQGHDVHVGGVRAYSTLGWFRDPVLNTFIFDPEPELADLLFHELAHQVLFVPSDTDFNEAFATAVAEEGVRRWLLAKGKLSAFEACQASRQCEAEFVRLSLDARSRLASLYQKSNPAQGASGVSRNKPALSETSLRHEKRRILAELRAQVAALSDCHLAPPSEFNNAFLNSVDTYYHLLPAFRHLLQQEHGDLPRFYRAVKALAKLKKEERHRHLERLASGP